MRASCCRTSLDADQNALDSEVKGSTERLFSTSPSIVHTGAVLTILRLIPAIVQVQGYKAATLNLQVGRLGNRKVIIYLLL